MNARILVAVVLSGVWVGCGGTDASDLFGEAPGGGDAALPDGSAGAIDGAAGGKPDGAAGGGPDGAAGGKPDGAAGGGPDGAAGSKPDATVPEDTGPGPDVVPPDTGCVSGQTRTEPCGVNGRGILTESCDNGEWIPGECVDPDVCLDGAQQTVPCGPGGEGSLEQLCELGQWEDASECEMPLPQTGRWECTNGACEPSFGDPLCGDDACEPSQGESPSSCPADCGAMTTQNGQGKACNEDLDRAFYAWPSTSSGYWNCQWSSGQDYCNAVKTNVYCDTTGYKYCYFGSSGLETPASCPADCSNKMLNQSGQDGCSADRDCIFLDWPVNQH